MKKLIALLLFLPGCFEWIPIRPEPVRPIDATEVPGARDVAESQRMSQWCWAACIRMVLRTGGTETSQAEIVTDTFGAPVDRPAGTLETIVAGLEREGVSATAHRRALSESEVREIIDSGNLIIAAVRWNPTSPPHHVVVIYGYAVDAHGGLSVLFFDPMPNLGFQCVPLARFWHWSESVVCDLP